MAREPETIAQQRRALGERLTAFRQAADLTQVQLAKTVFCARSTLAHIERGHARADERFWRACDDAVNAEGALLSAFHDLADAKQTHEEQEHRAQLAQARARAEHVAKNRRGTSTAASPLADDIQLVDAPVPSVRLDSGYVETLHSRIHELVLQG